MDYSQNSEITSDNSDEDDYTGYFMQPVNAYNIKTKIDTANKILFAEEHDSSIEKQSVVKFSVNLFEFEPDNSYYSEIDESEGTSIIEEVDEDNIIDEEISIIDEEPVVDNQIVPISKPNDIIETKSIDIINSRVASLSIEEFSNDIETVEEDTIIENVDTGDNINENSSLLEEEQSSSSISDDKLNNKLLKKSKKECKEIICDKYCKEFYNLNTDNTSPCYQPGLVLKLHRTCCDHSHHEKSLLPFYNGLNSEYGLSQKQIERKLKNTERKLKKEKELQIRKEQEYYERSEQCERTFCNWLRSKIKFKKSDNKKHKKQKLQRPTTENVKSVRKTTKKSSIKNNIVIPLSSSDFEESSKKLKQFTKFKSKSNSKRTFHIHFIVS